MWIDFVLRHLIHCSNFKNKNTPNFVVVQTIKLVQRRKSLWYFCLHMLSAPNKAAHRSITM